MPRAVLALDQGTTGSIELDAERMVLVLRKALALREPFFRQDSRFLSFLESLDA